MKKWMALLLSLVLLLGVLPMEALAVEKPEGTKVSVCNNFDGIKVSWNAVDEAESYRVYRKTVDGDWVSLKKGLTQLQYTDSTAQAGVRYRYAVRVYNAAGSTRTQSSEITRVLQPEFTAANMYNGIKISWDKVDEAESYNVYRKTSSGEWKLLHNTTGLSFLDNSAEDGANYNYRVRAKADENLSSDKLKVTVRRMAKPEVSRYNVHEGIKLEWEEVTGASYYRVYRKDENGKYKSIKNKITSLSFTDTDVEEGKEYKYAVRSYDSTGGSAYSYTASLLRVGQPEVTAVNKRAGVVLEWNELELADSYNVYRKTGSGSWKLLINTTKTTYTDKTAVGGTKYSYTVRAKVGSALGSNKLKATIVRLGTPSPAVSAVHQGPQIKWEKVEGAASYSIYRKTTGKYKLIAEGVTELKFTDTTAVGGTTYTYAVRAYKNGSYSSYGAADKHQYLARPVLTATTLSKKSIKLTWDEVKGAESYTVYIKNDAGEWTKYAATTATSYTVSNLVFGKKYSFAVRAMGSLDNSTKSAAKSAKATFPAMNFTLALNPGKGIKISWKAVSGAASYRVYRKTVEGDWKLIKTTTSTSYTDTEGRSGVTYLYTVRAYELKSAKGVAGVLGEGKEIVYSKIDPDKPMIALTFDDGPSIYTDEILDVLEKYDARATFFVVGNRIEYYEDSIERAYDLGCEIGNHSWSHPLLTDISVNSLKNEISRTDKAVEAITGEKPALIRPPYGGVNSTVSKYAGKPLINWSVDTLDWETQSSSSTYYSIMNDGYDGAIVLMHDIYYATKEGVIRAIPQLVKNGYQLVTVSELAAYRGVDMKDGTVYYHFKP